jgi:hypothetical protein
MSCSILITGMSYTATNLLYDFEGRPPVHADDDDTLSTALPLTNQTLDSENPTIGKDPDQMQPTWGSTKAEPRPGDDAPGFCVDVDKTPAGSEGRNWGQNDSTQLARPSDLEKDAGVCVWGGAGGASETA